MKKIVLALALVASTPAFAWGEREQGALAGIVGTILFQNMTRPHVVQPPVVIHQPPVYNYSSPVYNLPHVPHRTPIYERRSQWDPACNCYIVVYNQIGWQ